MARITTIPPGSSAAVPPVAAGGVQHDVPGGGAVPGAPLRVPAGVAVQSGRLPDPYSRLD